MNSNTMVWWLCPKEQSYQAKISDLTFNNHCCSYCSGRKVGPGFNDLSTLRPDFAAEWHPTLNGSLKVTIGSKRKVWWQCNQGRAWKARIDSRARKNASGCPICSRQQLYQSKSKKL